MSKRTVTKIQNYTYVRCIVQDSYFHMCTVYLFIRDELTAQPAEKSGNENFDGSSANAK